jgi:hypothetical protein
VYLVSSVHVSSVSLCAHMYLGVFDVHLTWVMQTGVVGGSDGGR